MSPGGCGTGAVRTRFGRVLPVKVSDIAVTAFKVSGRLPSGPPRVGPLDPVFQSAVPGAAVKYFLEKPFLVVRGAGIFEDDALSGTVERGVDGVLPCKAWLGFLDEGDVKNGEDPHVFR